jgi:hypothetical protein
VFAVHTEVFPFGCGFCHTTLYDVSVYNSI